MSIVSLKMPLIAFLATAAALSGQSVARAADLMEGYHSQRAAIYRERPRVVRTTYIRREVQECQTLKIREYGYKKFVDVCFRPFSLAP
ncbi:hypothetical protein [Rhizobium terrae]|uniref:hypothetical protein n=1 Tax=Rhizobium terrae TaxID=2171756 RepID=UPI000E3DBEF6|nr:hypothetical protein [Rhizobium terrae]